jgi:hypothetical protein
MTKDKFRAPGDKFCHCADKKRRPPPLFVAEMEIKRPDFGLARQLLIGKRGTKQ